MYVQYLKKNYICNICFTRNDTYVGWIMNVKLQIISILIFTTNLYHDI